MRFFVLFLIFVVFGFAVFGALGMMEAMEYGHGFCFAASAGPLCPEVITAFISHLADFQNIFVSVLQKIFAFISVATLYALLILLPRGAYSRFAFSFPSRIFRQNFVLRFAVVKQKFLSWLAFHEQSPAVFADA